MKYLLIPSAKLAPADLPNYGEIPMALYPVNGHPILYYILENYPAEYRVLICGFEAFDSIQNYLQKEADRDVALVKLDALGNLGDTVLAMLDALDFSDGDEVVINFADTLIETGHLQGDALYSVPQSETNSKWTYFSQKNGEIVGIIDKSAEAHSCAKPVFELFTGLFSISNPSLFKALLKRSGDRDGVDLFAAMQEYSKVYPFVFLRPNRWLDLGHPETYFNSLFMVKARDFNSITCDLDRGILRKTSLDTKKFRNEISWYLSLPSSLAYAIPRIFEYKLEGPDPYIEMELYSYPTLLELSLFGNLSKQSWERIFAKINFLLKDFARFEIRSDKIPNALMEMYWEKTQQRVLTLKNNPHFSSFFSGRIRINGNTYVNLSDLLSLLKPCVHNRLLNITDFRIIHGDLCFSNILIDDRLNFIKLIDPRGAFGPFDIYGDWRYDLAKLFHSVDGKYDFIIKDLFNISRSQNEITYTIFDARPFSLFELMKTELSESIGSQLEEIEIIEALLFLSMIPLHSENPNHQYAMLARGIEILSRHLNIRVYEGED